MHLFFFRWFPELGHTMRTTAGRYVVQEPMERSGVLWSWLDEPLLTKKRRNIYCYPFQRNRNGNGSKVYLYLEENRSNYISVLYVLYIISYIIYILYIYRIIYLRVLYIIHHVIYYDYVFETLCCVCLCLYFYYLEDSAWRFFEATRPSWRGTTLISQVINKQKGLQHWKTYRSRK